jgi:hypothetical protein
VINIQIPPISTPTIAPAIGGIFRLLETLTPNVASAIGDITLLEMELLVEVVGKC